MTILKCGNFNKSKSILTWWPFVYVLHVIVCQCGTFNSKWVLTSWWWLNQFAQLYPLNCLDLYNPHHLNSLGNLTPSKHIYPASVYRYISWWHHFVIASYPFVTGWVDGHASLPILHVEFKPGTLKLRCCARHQFPLADIIKQDTTYFPIISERPFVIMDYAVKRDLWSTLGYSVSSSVQEELALRIKQPQASYGHTERAAYIALPLLTMALDVARGMAYIIDRGVCLIIHESNVFILMHYASIRVWSRRHSLRSLFYS